MTTNRKNNSTPLKQLTLNFGQKPKEVTKCSKCDMVFNAQDKEDEQIHFRYHAELEKSLVYSNTLISNEKLVKEWLDGKCVVIQVDLDAKQYAQKACQVLKFIETELGIVNEKKNQPGLSEKNSFSNLKPLSKVYLFVSHETKKIEGVCLAEPITKAYRIKYINEEEGIYACDESKEERVECGISRIWVSANMRKKRIGYRLLDCVCCNFLYVNCLSCDQIAFSSPTEMGQSLAKCFTNKKHFLVYNKEI